MLADYDPYATPNDSGDIGLAQEQMSQSKYDTDGDGRCDAPECEDVLAIYASDSATGRKIAALCAAEPGADRDHARCEGVVTTTPMYAKCNNLAEQVPVCLQVGWLPGLPRPVHVRAALVRRLDVRRAVSRLLQLLGGGSDRGRDVRVGLLGDVRAERRRQADGLQGPGRSATSARSAGPTSTSS